MAGVPEVKRVPAAIVASGPGQQIDLQRATQKGPAEAPINVVEFSDFECPFCAQAAPTITQLLAGYPTTIRFV